MKRYLVLILCAVFALVLSGCIPALQPEPTPTPVPPTETPVPSPTPTETPTPSPTVTPSPTPTITPIPSLMLENRSGDPICHVFISPIAAASWGDEDLHEGESIPDAGMRGFALDANVYNVWVADCDWNDVDVWWDVDIGDELVTLIIEPRPGLAGDARVTVDNNSGIPICSVYISPTAEDYWGVDWLDAEEVIQIGTSRTFRLPPDTYDILAEDCDFEDIDVALGVSITDEYTWNVGGADTGAPAAAPAPSTGNGFIYVENQLPEAGTCRISVWGNGLELLLDGGLGEPNVYEVPPGEYGWQAFIGYLLTNADAITITPGGYCTFTCLPEHLSWGCGSR